MNKHYLQSKMKSVGTAYAFYFLLIGAHFAYLNKWGLQFLFWFTGGGLGIWALIEMFTISDRVNKYNMALANRIEEIEKKEKQEDHARNIAMITAAKS